MTKNPHDPWELLGKILPSKCCKGKQAEIINYDHTGWIEVECSECKKQYVHDSGVIKNKEEAKLLAEGRTKEPLMELFDN